VWAKPAPTTNKREERGNNPERAAKKLKKQVRLPRAGVGDAG
jgi:hypothetical protein